MTNCAGKIGPALACGNTVVVKPSPIDPLGVAELCRIVDAVLPPGVVNFVNGEGAEIGEALVRSPDVDMISFTGSTAVGRRIKEAAAGRMKRTVLELGGKSANIIFADCDVDRALASAMSVWTFHSGQICIAGTRVLIEEPLYEPFTAIRASRASSSGHSSPPRSGRASSASSRAAARRGRRSPAAAAGLLTSPAGITSSRRSSPTRATT